MVIALSMSRSNNLHNFRLPRPATIALAVFFAYSLFWADVQAQPAPKQIKVQGFSLAKGDLLAEVMAGETLIDLAHRELAPPHDWRSLAKLNGLRNPLILPVGTKVYVPKAWRKPLLTKASVQSVEGPAQNKLGPLAVGAVLAESDVVHTSANSVVVLRLPDGTTVRIPPASKVRIDRLRGYHGSDAIDARLSLEHGGLEVQSDSSREGKPPIPGRNLEVLTPKATASVRGTSFRIGAQDEKSVAEILSGGIEWAGASERRALPGGFGVAVDPTGKLGPTEQLLQASGKLLSASLLEEIDAEIEFQSVAGADKYRLELSTDPSFSSLVATTLQSETKAIVRSERDGPHYFKVRAIAPSGVAGFDASFALNIAARPVAPPVVASEPAGINFGERTMLGWAPIAQAESYRLQVALDESFKNILTDERLPTPRFFFGPKTTLSEVTPYYWRVATVDNIKQGPWGNTRKMEFAPVLGGVTPQVQGDSVLLEWSGKPDQNFEAQLGRDPGFADLVISKEVKGVSWKLDSLPPGQYQMRVRRIFSNGSKGPFSPALALEIPVLLRDGSGQPMRNGSGQLIVIPR
jgi:hypothetical protein